MRKGLEGLIGGSILAALGVGLPSHADTPLDLNALIQNQCGRPGWSYNQGCRVTLGRGVWTLTERVRIGECSNGTSRNGLILEGEGSGPHATSPVFPTGGTTLKWQGSTVSPMIDVCGSSSVSIRDLALSAEGAAIGIRLLADYGGANTHFAELRDLVIYGARTGVYVGGAHYNDQTDFVRLQNVSMSNVMDGYVQDSQQSVGGRLETVEVVASRVAYRIGGGSLHCDGCYAGTTAASSASFIAFHLTRSTTNPNPNQFAHHQVVIANSHMELRTGRFIVDDAATTYPITLIGNSYSLQCPEMGCTMKVVDSNSTGPVNILGDVIQGLGQGPKAQYCLAGPVNQMGLVKKGEVAELIWSCQ
jgi:hypothetical protein